MNTKKTKKAPSETQIQSREKRRERVLLHKEHARKKIKEEHIKARKDVIKKLYPLTWRSRSGRKGSPDRPAYRYALFLNKLKVLYKKQADKFIAQINEIAVTKPLNHEEFSAMINKIEDIITNSQKQKRMLSQALFTAMHGFAGYDKEIDEKDYAVLLNLLDHVSKLYNTDLGKLFNRLRQNILSKKDWDIVCENIHKVAYKKEVSKDHDKVTLSTSAFLVGMMTPKQRFQLVLEYGKESRYGNDAGIKLADNLTHAGVLNIAQLTELKRKLTGDKKFELTPEEQQKYIQSQEFARNQTARITRSMTSPAAINAAERMLNRRTIPAFILTAIGFIGMLTNFVSGIKKGPGGRLSLKGVTSPYFKISALGFGLGLHLSQNAMYPGKPTAGWFTKFMKGEKKKLYVKEKGEVNPFGVSEYSTRKERSFNVLAHITGNYPQMEKWLLEGKGFDHMYRFLEKEKLDMTQAKYSIAKKKALARKKGKRFSMYDEMISYIKKQGDEASVAQLREAHRLYGKMRVEDMLMQIGIISKVVGIRSTQSFVRKKKIRGRKNTRFTYYDYLKHKQGIKSSYNG